MNTIPDWEALKLALNNAIWMHAPSSTTLGQADEAACKAISCISAHYNNFVAETEDKGPQQ